MKIVYYCYGGTHSSIIAAAIHTGQLSTEYPSKKEINNLPLYDKINQKELGQLFFYGADECGNLVYVLGLGAKRKAMKEFLLDYLRLCNINTKEVILVASLPYVSFFTKLGGILSRKLGLVRLGRTLVTYTLQKSYPKYTALVNQVKAQLKNMNK